MRGRGAAASIAVGLFVFGLFVLETQRHWDVGPVSPGHAAARVKQGAAMRDAAWYARRLPSVVVFGGQYSADNSLDGHINELLQGTDVTSWMEVTETLDSDFGRAQAAALKVLAIFKSGFVEIRGRRVTVDGVASGPEKERIQKQLAADLPSGYTLARLAVVPPDAEPYAFSAYRNESQVIELSGLVPNDAARESLIATAATFGENFQIVDRVRIRDDAPPGFSETARAAMLQLRQFDTGVVSLTGRRLDIVGRVPGIKWTRQTACELTLAVLPKGYSCGFIYIESPAIRVGRGWGGGRHNWKGRGGGGGGRSGTGGVAAERRPYEPLKAKEIETAPLRAMDYDPRLVDLYFATNREVKKVAISAEATLSAEELTGERGDSLRFGVVRVHIPDDHKIGQIKLPGGISVFGWKITTDAIDPKKHFFVRSRELLSREQWESYVRELKPTDALIFVHGFNNSFDDAAFRMAQIVWDLGYRGLPVLFSWPSRGGALNYLYDRDSAIGARGHFIELLQILQKHHGIEKIHVLSHSMGNFLVVDALANHARTSDPIRIAELIMAAPDLDRNQFIDEIPLLQQITKGLTLYVSSNDRALAVSRTIAGGIPRAGDVPASGPVVLPGLDTIDVSSMGEEMFGLNHNTFAAVRSLIDDIFILLSKGDRAPRLRQIRPVPEGANKPSFWRYAQ
jgi:esterase/lipase superfamily enzyme